MSFKFNSTSTARPAWRLTVLGLYRLRLERNASRPQSRRLRTQRVHLADSRLCHGPDRFQRTSVTTLAADAGRRTRHPLRGALSPPAQTSSPNTLSRHASGDADNGEIAIEEDVTLVGEDNPYFGGPTSAGTCAPSALARKRPQDMLTNLSSVGGMAS